MVVVIIKDWTFRKMLKAQLEEMGIKTADFKDIREASRVIGQGSLTVIDLMDGCYPPETLRYIREKSGGARLLVLRGSSGLTDRELKKEKIEFIVKRPVSIGHLAEEIKKCM